jgi:hypothetical protein
MIKMAVLQDDDEEVIKICRFSSIDSDVERPVHVLLTNLSLYILNPGDDATDGQYEIEAILPFKSMQGFGVGFTSKCFRLYAEGKAWFFGVGDEVVTTTMIDAICKAAIAMGVDPPRISRGDKRRGEAIKEFLELQGDSEAGDAPSMYNLGYFGFDRASLRDDVVCEGMLHWKDAGFLSSCGARFSIEIYTRGCHGFPRLCSA